ncbi:conserved hypothetical protein [Cellulomonas flavigena DSM 20109]|uniref:DUF4097 domain-containing protein n=1 Tax=Cellulomonas flavigena (strain ATCC 482 / DSM 20109 / BCRC 11376 / JCM 18109 / NBRC 3775 / NCIMB 8073 / NRS 134) TaxID=446466 RepID=D5ULA2_CELFN|nr:DUF4097 family beta strand repeat-containing protein [Cellulomonas flavigena]ADG75984.1 conserved hypothetical protein [Cellulomonas flavigena DSM 20109]
MTAARPTDVPTAPATLPAASAPRRRSPGGIALTVLGVALALAAVALGVLQGLAWLFTQESSGSATLAATDVVEVVADGQVHVSAEAVQEVRVDREAQYAWSAPAYDVRSDGERTVVRHRCPAIAVRCSADLSVTVPEGTRVVVRSGDGDVRVAGPSDAVTVRATDGDVHVSGTRGDVEVRGADGDVSVDDVRGAVLADVTDGALRVADVTGGVVVGTVDGRVDVLRVGGDVEARTTSGRLEVSDVRGALTATSTDGDVLVAAVAGDVTASTVDGDLTVHGNGEPVALTLDTAGRQRVEAPTDPDADVRVVLRAVDGAVAYLAP